MSIINFLNKDLLVMALTKSFNLCCSTICKNSFVLLRRDFSYKSKTETKYFEIYRFNQMRVSSLINKIKKYQLGATAVIVPSSLGSFALGLCDSTIPIITTTVGFASTFAIFSIGQIFTRFIGAAYVTKDLKSIKLSYLDYWGQRIDLECSTSNIMPLSSAPKYLTDYFYKNVYLTDSKKPLKLNIKLGEIKDSGAFREVFGFDPDD